MNLLQKLRDRKRSKTESASTTYWVTLTKEANTTLSDRALEALLDSLEPVLGELGKSDDDVETDLGLVRAYETARAANVEAAGGRAQAAALRGDQARLEARARELEGEAVKMHAKAEEASNQAQGLTMAADQAARELVGAERRLAAAGHRDVSARTAEAAKAGEIARLLGELRGLDCGVMNGRAAAAAVARMGPERGRTAHRAQIVARLRALGAKDIPPDREIERLLADLRDLDRGRVKGQPSATYGSPESRARYRAEIVSKLKALGYSGSTEPVVSDAG